MPAIGDEAPNFDLASTDEVVLMLRDEVPRNSVVLYFFADPAGARTREDLQSLARHQPALARLRTRILGVSAAPLPALKEAQRDLALPFPLLHDDRAFAKKYGVESRAEGEPPEAALFLVNARQKILWLQNPLASASEALPQVETALKRQPSSTAGYPRSVVNRLTDWWVN